MHLRLWGHFTLWIQRKFLIEIIYFMLLGVLGIKFALASNWILMPDHWSRTERVSGRTFYVRSKCFRTRTPPHFQSFSYFRQVQHLVYPSVCPSVRLSVCPVCLSVSPSMLSHVSKWMCRPVNGPRLETELLLHNFVRFYFRTCVFNKFINLLYLLLNSRTNTRKYGRTGGRTDGHLHTRTSRPA